MYFDFPTFVRQKVYAFTHGASDGPWLLTACQLLLYPLVHAGFALDERLHPEIAATPVRSPVFIVSSPRSGSTLLLELLASDPQTATHSTSELIFPSPTLRRILPPRVIAAADALFRRRFAPLELIHPMRFEQPEEDELLFLLLGNSGINSYLFPYGPELDHLLVNRFWEWPDWKRERFGQFYQRCLQRLLWARQVERYVGKSPHFLGKIDDLLRWFPDARFVYLVRSPEEWLPSALSMITTFWTLGTARPPSREALETIYRALRDLALRGDDMLARLANGAVATVRYTALVTDPCATVKELYEWLGWPMTRSYFERLTRGTAWHRSWRSRHRYSLEQFGLTRGRVREELAPLFERYGFDRQHSAVSSDAAQRVAV